MPDVKAATLTLVGVHGGIDTLNDYFGLLARAEGDLERGRTLAHLTQVDYRIRACSLLDALDLLGGLSILPTLLTGLLCPLLVGSRAELGVFILCIARPCKWISTPRTPEISSGLVRDISQPSENPYYELGMTHFFTLPVPLHVRQIRV